MWARREGRGIKIPLSPGREESIVCGTGDGKDSETCSVSSAETQTFIPASFSQLDEPNLHHPNVHEAA